MQQSKKPISFALPPSRVVPEQVSLLDRAETQREIRWCIRASGVASCACVFLILLIGALVGVAYRRVNSTLEGANLSPEKMTAATSHALHILENLETSSVNTAQMTDRAEALTATALPALGRVVNETLDAMEHIDHLMRKPTIRLQLGDR
jgi:hypothetical protein